MIGEDVELALDLDADLAHVLVDAAQVEQVLANLAINARDAMPRGGRLLISTRNVELNGDARAVDLEPGAYVRLSVADTGFGMDEQTAARAFDPFFTTKAEGHGTGLGLATVHGIVAQSGGSVLMRSVPDQGTTVSIHLPAVEAESPVATRVAELEGPLCLDGTRVLLVEDEPIVRRLLEFFLAKLGCVFTSTADGTAALEASAAAEAPFDLVVTDLVLPGMSGCELVERLATPEGVPLALYLSGYSRDADLREATASGRGGFLQKPFTGDELGVAMRSLLRAGGGA
jgi:CheY-like chemotaxis protein